VEEYPYCQPGIFDLLRNSYKSYYSMHNPTTNLHSFWGLQNTPYSHEVYPYRTIFNTRYCGSFSTPYCSIVTYLCSCVHRHYANGLNNTITCCNFYCILSFLCYEGWCAYFWNKGSVAHKNGAIGQEWRGSLLKKRLKKNR